MQGGGCSEGGGCPLWTLLPVLSSGTASVGGMVCAQGQQIVCTEWGKSLSRVVISDVMSSVTKEGIMSPS